MKQQPGEKRKRGDFLNKPEYDGGNAAFRKFIKENLVYPTQAIENQIEGFVLLNAIVDDNGQVIDVKVIKGLGYGCDEEAVRVVKLIKYEKVKNQGVRLVTTKKIRISFTLPVANNQGVNYIVSPSVKKNKLQKKIENPQNPQTYGYTIEW